MILLKIFLEFLKIGAFSFGGGMATLPYVYEMSEKTAWIEQSDISKILSVTQVTPGPLACNMGTIIGMKQNGVLGALVANIAFVIPAICFVGVCYKFLDRIKKNDKANEIIKIVRSAALAILITSSITLFKGAFINDECVIGENLCSLFNLINYKSILLGICAFFIGKYKKIPTLYLMFFISLVGGIMQI